MEILKQRPSRNPKEVLTFALLVFLSSITLLTTLGVILSLVGDVAQFFRRVPLTEFLFAPEWTPLFADPRYGISPLIAGTFLVTLIALLVAVPLGLALAIYLSEYASGAARARIKGTLELFEGIPTVVFGYFALLFVTPLLQRVIPDLNIFNPLSAGLVMGFAIIPYISNVAADAMESVPRSIREAAYALGARPYEVALRVVFPAAISGIIAAIILATSRAIGETMIVAIAAGQRPILTLDPRETIATMTSYIVQAATGDQPTGSTAYYALFAVGFTLFLLTLFLNILAQYVVERYRERYE
ncbi:MULTISPECIES: phosphate ABC transporter permease subunit PstC [Thermus]|jgi:phosphate transport system permease protein|uniref:Phosphate transport system permease protein n=1 Tax=Thermus thermophilus (strain ATCC 27634 / DSM 579 / HB8) TaxID=300852 RepID=Q5SLN3_THET8|nr:MULTISPECIES: phosphate ABC transporter permease subunit PstC [Thermus]QZY58785.1 phosphate ABC transporter permease subunit PstC [Thermus thermophilus]BAD70083.1 probable phosphate ABC transporter, permease protein [Thermus thermophilus HB8]BCP97009.1 phosphate transport system permease protein [Thermus thermophilus]BCP99341.1 phosphate transport system permease protein [Thermus thermophilus]BDA36898.1 phosphate transport system permease protein [Thermus thermophilus]